MATYIGKTTSNNPTVSDPPAVREIIDDYTFLGSHDTLSVGVEEGKLYIYGGADFVVRPSEDQIDHPDEIWDEILTEEFLNRIAPYVQEKLVIQSMGSEKVRFPFGMTQYVVTPDGRVGRKSHTESDSIEDYEILSDGEERNEPSAENE